MKFKGTIDFVPETDLIRFLPNVATTQGKTYTLCVPSAGCNGTLSAENTFGGNPGTHLTMPPAGSPEYAASSFYAGVPDAVGGLGALRLCTFDCANTASFTAANSALGDAAHPKLGYRDLFMGPNGFWVGHDPALRRSSGPVSPRSSLLLQIFTHPRTSSSQERLKNCVIASFQMQQLVEVLAQRERAASDAATRCRDLEGRLSVMAADLEERGKRPKRRSGPRAAVDRLRARVSSGPCRAKVAQAAHSHAALTIKRQEVCALGSEQAVRRPAPQTIEQIVRNALRTNLGNNELEMLIYCFIIGAMSTSVLDSPAPGQALAPAPGSADPVAAVAPAPLVPSPVVGGAAEEASAETPAKMDALPMVGNTALSLGCAGNMLDEAKAWAESVGAQVIPEALFAAWKRQRTSTTNVGVTPCGRSLVLEVRGPVERAVTRPVKVPVRSASREVEVRWRLAPSAAKKTEDLGWRSGRSEMELEVALQAALDEGTIADASAVKWDSGMVFAAPADLVSLKVALFRMEKREKARPAFIGGKAPAAKLASVFEGFDHPAAVTPASARPLVTSLTPSVPVTPTLATPGTGQAMQPEDGAAKSAPGEKGTAAAKTASATDTAKSKKSPSGERR
ncbi:hypothetical protein PAPYR_13247 [Paratrimastix pyriformis]|uniref:Uncharacterized protein n=1 Tax=Paratrimastix pyriformis TaxID=342808 RepID=A0ABQ8U4Q1_9EUKA|nr:hypothetical protein PAPYR_13247 [Paratrimastix pyriformis]